MPLLIGKKKIVVKLASFKPKLWVDKQIRLIEILRKYFLARALSLSLSLSLSFFSFFPTILLGQKTGNCFCQNYAEKNRLVQNFLKKKLAKRKIICLSQSFFWSILWCSDIDHHPQEPTSARDWKVEKFKNPAIFLWPAGTYCLNMAISEKKISKFGNFDAFFPLKKSFVWVTLDHFGHQVVKISPKTWCKDDVGGKPLQKGWTFHYWSGRDLNIAILVWYWIWTYQLHPCIGYVQNFHTSLIMGIGSSSKTFIPAWSWRMVNDWFLHGTRQV